MSVKSAAYVFIISLFAIAQGQAGQVDISPSESGQSKVPSLKRIIGKALIRTIEKEAEKSEALTLVQLHENFNPGNQNPEKVQELTFGFPYRPRGPLQPIIMMYMTSVDLSQIEGLGHYFSQNPDYFQFLTHTPYLKTLNISHNRLKEQVRPLRFLTTLTSLDVSGNNLGEHVSALQSLTALTSLDVSGNNLGEHVSALRPLTALTSLNVASNELGEHVSALQPLTTLTSLTVGGNNLGEYVVSALRSLTALTSLDVGCNNLGEHVSALRPLTALTSLNVASNELGEHVSALQVLFDRGVKIME